MFHTHPIQTPPDQPRTSDLSPVTSRHGGAASVIRSVNSNGYRTCLTRRYERYLCSDTRLLPHTPGIRYHARSRTHPNCGGRCFQRSWSSAGPTQPTARNNNYRCNSTLNCRPRLGGISMPFLVSISLRVPLLLRATKRHTAPHSKQAGRPSQDGPCRGTAWGSNGWPVSAQQAEHN